MMKAPPRERSPEQRSPLIALTLDPEDVAVRRHFAGSNGQKQSTDSKVRPPGMWMCGGSRAAEKDGDVVSASVEGRSAAHGDCAR